MNERVSTVCEATTSALTTRQITQGSSTRSKSIFKLFQWVRKRIDHVGFGTTTGIGFGTGDSSFALALPGLSGAERKAGLLSFDAPSKVLILYELTGGGHKASAQALRDAFEMKYPGKFEVVMMDVLPLCAPPFNKSDKFYDFMVKHSFLWKGAFAWSSTQWGEKIGFAWYKVGLVDNLRKLFRDIKPDLIVSVHPLLQVPVLAALKSNKRDSAEPRRVPFATVVTDYTTCHATWFDRGVDKCFVPTVETKKFGERRGLTASQIAMHGLPIRPAFSGTLPCKSKLRNKLRMDKNLSSVLMVGGGDGMGPVEATCCALDTRMNGNGQIVVICGRNAKLVSKLTKRDWVSKVIILGFVSNMHEWMAACDCIVTKAGPGTIAESLVCGLPIMLNNFIPCQEAGNIPWVIENGVGDYSSDPDVVASKVISWFQHKKLLYKMKRKTLQLGRPDATFKIVEDLVELIRQWRWEPYKASAVRQKVGRLAAATY